MAGSEPAAGRIRAVPAHTWACPTCGESNPAYTEACRACTAPAPADVPPLRLSAREKNRLLIGAGLLFVWLPLAVIFVLLLIIAGRA